MIRREVSARRGIHIPLIFAFVAACVVWPFGLSIPYAVFVGTQCLDLGNDAPRYFDSVNQTQVDDDTTRVVVPTRRLEFVHIPKTGGTVIESEAARHNITWSICHFGIPQNVLRISLNETDCPDGSLKHWWPGTKKYHACPWWHVPPQYFELHEVNPYAGADLFGVVRNPYDRLISEYFYMGTYVARRKAEDVNDVENLNKWVETSMRDIIGKVKRGDISRNRTGNGAYFRSAGHFIPQYDYVFEHRRRIIKHVLRFENLTDEFHALMELYDLPIRLPRRRVRPSHSKTVTAYNLTRRNMELIERLYDNDFREWGYEILSETLP